MFHRRVLRYVAINSLNVPYFLVLKKSLIYTRPKVLLVEQLLYSLSPGSLTKNLEIISQRKHYRFSDMLQIMLRL